MSLLTCFLIALSLVLLILLLILFIDILVEYQSYGNNPSRNGYHKKLLSILKYFQRIFCSHSWKYSADSRTCTKYSKGT